MNLNNPYICDIETVGLLPDLTKGQEEDFHILGCSYKSGNEWKVITTNKKEDVFKLFENPDNVIVGHNFWLYDVPALEKIFPDLKIKATIIDTLWLSWYIEPNRIRHGLELYGEEFGVPKPEVTEDQWKGIGMTKEEHSALMKERVSEDVKINTNLWINILNKYRKLYNNDEEVIKSHIKFLMVKAKTYKMFLDNPLKINLTQANKNLGILEGLINEKVEVLRNVMPKVPKKVKRSKPKNIYKKDGTLSKAGERWNRITKGVGLDLEYEGEIEEIVDWLEPNPQSVHQVKDWLFSLGWKPEIFNDSTSVTGEVNKVPQVRDRNKDLCNSVLKLAEKEPAIKELDDLSVIQHRAGIIKGFIRDSDEEGNIVAGVGGLANTLRIKHRTLVNLPSVSAPYGEYIRSLIIPQEGYKFIGSDISGLENQTKLNFIYPYDPEYVKEMMGKYYDSHLDIGQTAGIVSLNESIFYRWYKDFIKGREVSPEDIVYGKENLPNDYQKYVESIEDKEKEFERIDLGRQTSKTLNYASVYSVGSQTLAELLGCSKSEASKLIDAYWKRNWSVQKFADDQKEKTIDGETWILNPINNYWYNLRSQHTRFSVLNQSAGDYIFTLWCYFCMEAGLILQAGFHDEVLVQSKGEDIEKNKKILQESMNKVNKILGLSIAIGIDYAVGGTYADVH